MSLQRRSSALLEQVRETVNSYSFPVTLRQIYYQLVARKIIPNEQRFYQSLSRLCVIGRDKGVLSEDSFADRLRVFDKRSSWEDLTEFAETVKRSYHRDGWQGQTDYIEIWTEKDALRGVIGPITEDYDVGLLVVRGQVSRTAIYEASRRYDGNEKERYLYYFGDFDPSGLSIYKSITERLGEFCPDVNFERVALKPEQIAAYHLPHDPAKRSDPNYKKFVGKHGDNVVELDALPPDVLRKMVESCIEAHIDVKVFERVRETEKREQKKWERALDRALEDGLIM